MSRILKDTLQQLQHPETVAAVLIVVVVVVVRPVVTPVQNRLDHPTMGCTVDVPISVEVISIVSCHAVVGTS